MVSVEDFRLTFNSDPQVFWVLDSGRTKEFDVSLLERSIGIRYEDIGLVNNNW
jgi:hypothetical protein